MTNYFPPSDFGWGYMQLCEEVADGLAARGHQVAILTSTYRNGPEPQRQYPVHRLLTIDPDWNDGRAAARKFFIGRRRRERQDIQSMQRLVVDFAPDIIFIWHAIGLSRTMLHTAELLAPTVYYLAGYLPELPDEHIAYWEAPPTTSLARLSKGPLARLALATLRKEGKPVPLKYENVICVSDYVRQRLIRGGLIPEGSSVIYNGVDLSAFSPSRTAPRFVDLNLIRCLIAGRIVPDKGIHTAIDAFALLDDPASTFRLTLLGDGPPEYMTMLRDKVQSYGMQKTITFLPSVPRGDLPQILEQHDILLLPSEYAEPIARSMQEGMAMGLLVIGTTTGGSGELLIHEETGLVHQAGDPHSLCRQLQRVVREPSLIRQIANQGQSVVHSSFTIHCTVTNIETYLETLINRQNITDN